MVETTMVGMAERLARLRHAGLRDKVGPYEDHLERVVALVEGDEARTVAWLHDIVEDTVTTLSELTAMGFPDAVVEAVRILTKVEPIEYRDYIELVATSGSALAKMVKVADLKDHLRPDTLWVLKAKTISKYEWALARLA